MKKFMTRKEAVAAIGVHYHTLHAMAKRGN